MERTLVINPGTTSTKIAVYDDSAALLRETVDHPQAELSRFHWVMDQLDYRNGKRIIFFLCACTA